ncbi:MAG: HEAT repeat domain-containing protein [Planctomycetaceae bacterium]|jgi:HEAT repeat protein|nr:HEAT repeat domain-containing protein [Planctomycetaceae bacterium]
MTYKNFTAIIAAALLSVCNNAFAQNEIDLSKYLSDFSSVELQKDGDVQGQEVYLKRKQAELEWQNICLAACAKGKENQLAEVNKQMTEQLKKEIPVVAKLWLLREIAWTGDASVTPTLVSLLNDKEYTIKDAATRALATISVPEALEALKSALSKATDANDKKRLEDAIASKSVDLTIGTETALPAKLAYAKDADTDQWLNEYEKLSDDDKARTLAALTVGENAAYRQPARGFAISAIQTGDGHLKRTGVFALEKLGTAEDLPLLLELFYNYDRGLAEYVLSRIADPKFDAALLKALAEEKEDGRVFDLGRILTVRNVKEVKTVLIAAAKKPETQNKSGYLNVVGSLASKDDAEDLIAILLQIPAGRDRDSAENTIAGIYKGDASPILEKATPQNTAALLPVVGRIGGDKALEFIHKYQKSENAEISSAAVLALCNWPNAVVADDLLAVAENKQIPAAWRIRSLRAFVRVISLPDNQIGIKISDKEKLAKLQKAMTLASQNAEKQLIIDRISAVRIPESVTYALQFIDDKDLAQNVCKTIAELAHQNFLLKANKDVFASALKKAIEVSTDNNLKDRLRSYQENLK